MAETGESTAELAAGLPRYFRKQGKASYEHGRLGTLMQALEESFPDARTDRSDGLKLLLDGGWIHARASNTEPLLRLAAEARSQKQVEELYARVARLLSDVVEHKQDQQDNKHCS